MHEFLWTFGQISTPFLDFFSSHGHFLKKDTTVKQIAFKIWVELRTRKIGLEIDEENDILIEVYNSWYEFFKIIRSLIKEIPASKVNDNNVKTLIYVSISMLNLQIRPHLTQWQARYRHWSEKNFLEEFEPQDNQKRYENYDKIISEIKIINSNLISYGKILEEIFSN